MKKDIILRTGEANDISGIYRCARCDREIVIAKGKKAPPCPRHGAIPWHLVRPAR